MNPKLMCFPHAGGNSSFFRTWKKYPATKFQVSPINLPARQSRFEEKMPERMADLVELIVNELPTENAGPFVFFGHSFGGIIAYEVARVLQKTRPISHLIVSACHPPPLFRTFNKKVSHLDKEQLIEEMFKRGGSPKEILENPVLLDMLLPVLRADYVLMDEYEWKEGEPLTCPIYAVGGNDDSAVTAEHLEGWRSLTSARFDTRIFRGGHFYLTDLSTPLLNSIDSFLSA